MHYGIGMLVGGVGPSAELRVPPEVACPSAHGVTVSVTTENHPSGKSIATFAGGMGNRRPRSSSTGIVVVDCAASTTIVQLAEEVDRLGDDVIVSLSKAFLSGLGGCYMPSPLIELTKLAQSIETVGNDASKRDSSLWMLEEVLWAACENEWWILIMD
jgi:hypothetical protein